MGELLDPFACACSRRSASDAHTAGSSRSWRRPLVCPGLANAHACALAAPLFLAPAGYHALTQHARSASVYPPSLPFLVQVQANPEKAMQQVLAMVSLPFLSLSLSPLPGRAATPTSHTINTMRRPRKYVCASHARQLLYPHRAHFAPSSVSVSVSVHSSLRT